MATPTTEIDLREHLLPKHVEVFVALRNLATRVRPDRWCLVGGLMVLVVGVKHGASARRSEGTKDGDIVVDILADPEMLQKVTWTLRQELGFKVSDTIGGSGDFLHTDTGAPTPARCTLESGAAQIDVLCPENTTDDILDSVEGMRSLAIPGGTRALELSEMVDIFFHDDYANAEIRCPTLHGAIIAKAAAAIDDRTREQPRHIQDVAFLLTLIEDPTAFRQDLTDHDMTTLAAAADRVTVMPTWDYLTTDDRQTVEAALRLIIR